MILEIPEKKSRIATLSIQDEDDFETVHLSFPEENGRIIVTTAKGSTVEFNFKGICVTTRHEGNVLEEAYIEWPVYRE